MEDDPEESSIKICGIGVHDQHLKAIQQGSDQHDEPADQGIVNDGGGHQDIHGQAGLSAQHGMHLVAKHMRFSGVLLPGCAWIGFPPSFQQGRIHDQFLVMIDFILTTPGLRTMVVVHASYPTYRSSQSLLRFSWKVSERSHTHMEEMTLKLN